MTEPSNLSSSEGARSTSTLKEQWGKLLALASLVAIALGSFNDSMDALEKIYDFSLSQFTDIPSQNKLDSVYVRASAAVLDEQLGAPIYLKHSSHGETIKYYQDGRFILSAVVKEDAIAAYLVFPLDGFIPDTSKSAKGSLLLQHPFNTDEEITDFRVSYSRAVTYYLEESAEGAFSNLYSSVSGYSEFDVEPTQTQREALAALANAMVLGDDVVPLAETLRAQLKPNFYGYSMLGLQALEEAILTRSEYQLIQP